MLEKLPPTDSRLRPDQRCLENGEYDMANSEKLRLEQRQRQVNHHMTFLSCCTNAWLLQLHNQNSKEGSAWLGVDCKFVLFET